MLSQVEITAIAKTVVLKAKAVAKVEQGSLKKSISQRYVNGGIEFRELYYGQWNDNSQLEKIARDLMPNGVKYKIIYTTLGGDTYEISRTKTGRKSQKKAVAIAKRNSSNNIKKLISLVQANRKKDEKDNKEKE